MVASLSGIVIILTLGVLAFGLFVVVMIVIRSIRSRKQWAGESLVLTPEQAAGLEDPAAGGWPMGTDPVSAEDLGVAQAQSRTLGYLTSPDGSGPL